MNGRLTCIALLFSFRALLGGDNAEVHDSYPEVHFSKIQYPLSNEPIDVVIPCAPKDLKTLELAIDGIRKTGRAIRRIIVVSKERFTTKAEWFNEELYPFSKKDLAFEIFPTDEDKAKNFLTTPGTRIGWLYQQLIKLYAPFVIPDISSNVLILDADVIFLGPISSLLSFQSAKTLGPLFTYGSEHVPHYFAHAARLLPGLRRVYPGYSGIAHHMLLQRPILEDLFAHIESYHHVELWKAFCRCIDHSLIDNSFSSEYEIYFNFTLLRTDQAEIRSLRWANTAYLTLGRFRKQEYDYIACHTWEE